MPQSVTSVSSQASALQQLAEEYEGQPLIRALVQLILAPLPYGIGNALDDALTSAIQNIRANRARVFFDELAKGSADLTEEVITSNDFLHAYFATTKAVLNTRREEKIRLFARLLMNGVSMQLVGSEQFEEFLAILNDLSIEELNILLILRQIELDPGRLKPARLHWPAFQKEVQAKCRIEADVLCAKLARLNRTGLYATETGGYIGGGGGWGNLTVLFSEFVKWIEVKNADV
jgi:hypothetical protein